MWAAQEGHKAAVEFMIARNANVNYSNKVGACALYCAALHGRSTVCEALLKAGANKKARVGIKTSAQWAAQKGHTDLAAFIESFSELAELFKELDLEKYLPAFQAEEYELGDLVTISDDKLATLIPKEVPRSRLRGWVNKRAEAKATVELKEGLVFGEAPHTVKLVRLIGAGAFGQAWEAVDESGKRCAIKFLKANDETRITKGIKELLSQAKAHSSFVAPVRDVQQQRGWLLLFLDLFSCSLASKLQPRHAADLKRFGRKWALQIAIAILDLHSGNIVHRDVKPDNILLDNDQNAFLADFGLAKQLMGPAVQTQETGTRGFMAHDLRESIVRVKPERVCGADYYAFAITLLQILVPWNTDSDFTDEDELLQAIERVWLSAELSVKDPLYTGIVALVKETRSRDDMINVVRSLRACSKCLQVLILCPTCFWRSC